MKKWLPYLFVLVFTAKHVRSQTDTLFWFGAPDLNGNIASGPNADRPIYLRISATSSPANIRISQPANPGFTPINAMIASNGTQSFDLTSYILSIEHDQVNKVLSNGLLITSSAPVSCYYDIVNNRNGSTYSLKGNNALGKKFTIPFQMSFINRTNAVEATSNKNDFVIVASEDNTEVQIKAKNDLVGYTAGSTHTITLQKGETYMCRANTNLPSQRPGGTLVTATKPISISVNEDLLQYPNAGCADAAGDQLIPDNLAGTEFIVVKGRFTGTNPDYFYVFATENNTSVKINGASVATINAGDYYEWRLSDESCYVETSGPVQIYHISGFGCEVSASVIPSIKCTGSTRVNITRASAAEEFYVNVIAPKEIIGDFRINNDPSQLPASFFFPVIGNSKWMRARFSVSPLFAGTDGNITIENGSGKFHAGVIQGGASSTSRYGYFSDFSTNTIFLKDPKNPNAQLKEEKIFCYKDTASILVVNTEKDIQFKWTGPNGFQADTSLLIFNSFLPKDTGLYTITTTSPGCGSSSKNIRLKIDRPIAAFDFTTNGCMEDSVIFSTDKNAGVRWKWNFGNGQSIDTNDANPLPIKFNDGGDIQVSLKVGSALGCFSDDTLRTVSLSTKPIARYTVPDITCVNDRIIFRDASAITTGSINKWKWDLDDGNGFKEYNNNADRSAIYPQWGAKKIRLVVVSHTGCISDTFRLDPFKINPLPKPGFIIPEVCLDDATAKFIDSTSSPDGFNQFTYLWKFNAGSTPVSPGPIFSLAQTTEKDPAIRYMSTGRYEVRLIVNSRGCIDSITQSFKVNGTNPVPAFDIIIDQSFCSNDSIRIVNRSTIDFDNVTRLEISWDEQNPSLRTVDEVPVIGKQYAVRYPSFQSPLEKKIRITLRAFSGDALSCSKTITKEITVFASPKVSFSQPPAICLDAAARQISEARYDDRIPGSFIYSGKGISPGGLFDPMAAGVGDHEIRFFYVADQTGCRDSATNTIKVWPLPEARFTVDTFRCEKNLTMMTSASVANAGGLNEWIWNYGDGSPEDTIRTTEKTTHRYAGWGNYPVSLRVRNSNGCFSPVTTSNIEVHPLPQVAFNLPKICLPEARAVFVNNSTIADGSGALMSYKWDFNDPFNNSGSVSRDGVHAFRVARSYDIKLVITSKDNCKDSLTQLFTDIFPQPKAAFISEDSICIGDLINVRDSSTAFFGTVTRWDWNMGDNNTEKGERLTYRYTRAGTYTISHHVTTSIGCLSDTATKMVYVYDYPVISAGPDLEVLDDGQKKILATASGKIISYQWTPSVYLSSADSLQPFIIRPQQDQLYTLHVKGRGNCISTDEMKMKVVRLPKPPNTFTPNGDGINDTWEILYLDQYPRCQVEIYSTNGQVVHRSVGYPKPWDGKYNGKDMPAGTYYFVIEPGNEKPRMAGYLQLIR